MKIKYEMGGYDHNHTCLTKCPYDNNGTRMVNSHSCQKCYYFSGRDIKNKTVECSYCENRELSLKNNVIAVHGYDCKKCILGYIGCYSNCEDTMSTLFGIKCHLHNCHFEFKKEFIECNKENTKVGDIVYLKEDEPKESWVVKYVSNNGNSGRYHDNDWDFIIGTEKLGDYPDKFKNYVIEK